MFIIISAKEKKSTSALPSAGEEGKKRSFLRPRRGEKKKGKRKGSSSSSFTLSVYARLGGKKDGKGTLSTKKGDRLSSSLR